MVSALWLSPAIILSMPSPWAASFAMPDLRLKNFGSYSERPTVVGLHNPRARVRLLVGVVARAHQGTRLHVPKSHLQRFFLQEAELIWRVEPRQRQVIS